MRAENRTVDRDSACESLGSDAATWDNDGVQRRPDRANESGLLTTSLSNQKGASASC